MSTDDLQQLRALEESLWRPEMRWDDAYMDTLLAADFFEFGRSGRRYDRQAVLATPPRNFSCRLPFDNFRVTPLDVQVYLVTYVSEVSATEQGDEHAGQKTNRCSIWTKQNNNWLLRFHQGTPTAG